VFPYAAGVHLDDEDSLSIPEQSNAGASRCAIIRFPRISNTTDFHLLPDACWITGPIDRPFDFIFLPGTKNTARDLEWLRSQGLDTWLRAQHERGAQIIGICGGYQMLGKTISDPFAVESEAGEIAGLNLLPIRTTMATEKTTRVVQARTPAGHSYTAYEIHMGQTRIDIADPQPFALLEDRTKEGLRHGRITGTCLHGALEDPIVLSELGISVIAHEHNNFDRLADWFQPFSADFERLFL
jgi:adenosylcobyric acid synthase